MTTKPQSIINDQQTATSTSSFSYNNNKYKYDNNIFPEYTLNGTVETVIYRSDETQFNILKLNIDKPVKLKRFLNATSSGIVTLDESLLSSTNINVNQIDKSKFTIKGNGTYLSKLKPGDSLSVSGAWQQDERYGGQQFHVLCRSLDDEAMSVKIMKEYLSSGSIKGVGPSTANKIVDALEESDLKILFSSRRDDNDVKKTQEDKNISNKLMKYPGFGKKTVATIVNGMLNNYNERQIILGLLAQGFSASQAKMLHGRYGAKSLSIMTENPYLLVEDVQGFGFNTADKIAQKEGISANSEFRIASGILHTLSVGATGDGHCCLKKNRIIDKTMDLLQKSKREMLNDAKKENTTTTIELEGGNNHEIVELEKHDIEKVIHNMLGKNQLRQIYLGNVDDNNNNNNNTNMEDQQDDISNKILIYHPKMYIVEKTLAEKIVSCNTNMSKEMLTTTTLSNDGVEKTYPSNLSTEQIDAIKMACDITTSSSLLSVVTGGPGTGKTYVMREIVNSWQNDLKLNVILASPTARAAQRLGEAAGDVYKGDAKTIHRLLDYNRRINKFLRNKYNPLEYDAIVIDEASMLDVHLVSFPILYIFPYAYHTHAYTYSSSRFTSLLCCNLPNAS